MRLVLIIYLFIAAFSLKGSCFSNPLDGKVSIIQVDSLGLELFHYSHISPKFREEARQKIIYGSDFVFSDSLNTESFLEVKKSSEGNTLFRTACPPFSKVLLSNNGKYIVGLSDMYISKYNVVVFNLKGEILFKKRISSGELLFSGNELMEFINLFPCYFEEMLKDNAVSRHPNGWGIFPARKQDSVYNAYLRPFYCSLTDSRLLLDILSNPQKGLFNGSNLEIEILEEESELLYLKIMNDQQEVLAYNLNDHFLHREVFLKLGWLEEEMKACEKEELESLEHRKSYNLELKLGDLRYRFLTKKQLLSLDKVKLEAGRFQSDFEFSSCSFIVLFENEGEIDFMEYSIDHTGLIPEQVFLDMAEKNLILKVGLENIKVAAPDGVRRISSSFYHVID